MKVPAKWLLGGFLLATLACESKEADRIDRLHEMCDELVGGTLIDAQAQFAGPSTEGWFPWAPTLDEACRTDWAKLRGDADTCDYSEEVCRLVWFFYTSDRNLCDPIRGCRFLCIMHVKRSDLEAPPEENPVPICATDWAQG